MLGAGGCRKQPDSEGVLVRLQLLALTDLECLVAVLRRQKLIHMLSRSLMLGGVAQHEHDRLLIASLPGIHEAVGCAQGGNILRIVNRLGGVVAFGIGLGSSRNDTWREQAQR